jgi:type VI protein secretion system component VasK
MGSLWIVIDVVAPLLLIGAIVWAYFHNRNAGRANVARAERGARELRREIEEDEARSGAP